MIHFVSRTVANNHRLAIGPFDASDPYINYNCACLDPVAPDKIWCARSRNHDVSGNTGETTRNFVRQNLYVDAALEYRGYQAVDSITEKELLENRGEEAIVKLNDRIATSLRESMEQALGTEWYSDGYASGNEETWIGLESMFGINGTINISTGATKVSEVGGGNVDLTPFI